MMKWIMRLAWLYLGQQMQNKAIDHAKRQGLVAYLQVLQGSRRLVALALVGFVILQTMVIAGFGALVTGVMLWDHELQDKLILLFGIFAGMAVLPMMAILVLVSERVWYKASGAKKMVEDLSKKAA